MISGSTVHCGQEMPHPNNSEGLTSRSLATPAEMEPVIDEILGKLAMAGFSKREGFSVRLALEEAIMNAIRHGHQFDRSKNVQVRFRVTPESLLAEIEDEGPGFDPGEVADPRTPECVERDCGRGLLLMRTFLDVGAAQQLVETLC